MGSEPKPLPSCQVTEYIVSAYLQNSGSATAYDIRVVVESNPKGASYLLEHWTHDRDVPYIARATRPIHPGDSINFFCTGYMPKQQPAFRIQIFAKDAEPTEWQIAFTEDEMNTGAEKKCERKALHFLTE